MSNIDSVDVRPRRILAVLACLCVSMSGMALYACATVPDPRVVAYGVAWEECARTADAAAEARGCMRAVNRMYGQDAGVSP